MRMHYYLSEGAHVIRIRAAKKPSVKNIPKRGTWIVNEYNGIEWRLPCFPEITWGTIKTLQYIGSLKIQPKTNLNDRGGG